MPANLSNQMTRRKPNALPRKIIECWQLYVLILPAITAVVIFHYLPIYGIQIAFKDFRNSLGIWGSPWIGFGNFIRFVTFPDFWKIIRNTVSISVYSIATFPCAIILALLINELDSKYFKKAVQMISYAPHFISVVVMVSMVRLFLNRDHGMINNMLAIVGFERQDFMTIPAAFSSIYVWSGVWQHVGWGTIIYLAALSGVSPELVEAASIDGASRLQKIIHVNIPHILPLIVTLLILNTGQVLSVGFEKIFLMQNNLNLERSRVISTYVYNMGIQNGQFSYSSAIGLFNNVVNIIIIFMVNQLSKKISSIGLW